MSIDLNKTTKSMRQYLELKRKYPDKILLYRIGDFYETFFEDAILFSKTCDITLTKKKYTNLGDVALAGIPKKVCEIYIKKLLENNLSVALAEQFENEQGDFDRKVVRIYTPASIYESELLDGSENNYLAAIYKDGNKYGFSYADTSDGTFNLSFGTKDEIARELVKISPKEIIINLEEMTFDFREAVANIKIFLFRPDCFVENKIKIQKDDFYLGYLAANAILNYLFENQKDFAPKLDDIKKYSVSDYVSMDFNTRRSLELTRTKNDFKKRGTLFWFLDNTKTPMGKRLLREWMNVPLNKLDEITRRQNAIKTFCVNPDLRNLSEKFLDGFCDLLRFSAKVSNKTINYKELVQVAHSLAMAKDIKKILEELKICDIGADGENLNILFDFSDIVFRTFDEDINSQNFEFLPVKNGVNPKLDILRADLGAIKDKLKVLEDEQKQKLHKNVLIKYLPSCGWCFEAPATSYAALNDDCILKQRLVSTFRYTTSELMEFEEKISSLKYQAANLEKDIFEKLKVYACELTLKIREFARICAFIDAINSLSKIVLEYSFCEAEFNDNSAYEAKNVFHPCVLKLEGDYVANDLCFDGMLLGVLTGANMTGKSTYLKQNALCILMAQMCGFAPAKSFNTMLFDRIFLHSGICDNLAKGESLFFAEMKNLAYILNNSTSKSFVALDEPAMGTNSADCEAILTALCEHMVQKTGAKTFVATHMLNVARKLGQNDKISVFKIDTNTRKILGGVVNDTTSFDVALDAGIDKSIIEKAKKYFL